MSNRLAGGRSNGSAGRPRTKSNLLHGVSGLGVLALAGLWATAAFAAPPPAAPAASTEVATVIVTATKRKENLQNVPIAVSAFTAKDIAMNGSQDVRDLAAPNFVFPKLSTGSLNFISIRGIFQQVQNIGLSSGVSEYIDGVYTGRNMSFNFDINDVDRVEILYGPQGTLFGKNTIAGVINVTTKQPGPVFGGDVGAEFGNYDLTHYMGSVNVPLIADVLALRVSGESETRGGYVKDVVAGGPDGGGINLTQGRAVLRFTPTDKLAVSLEGDHFVSKDVASGTKSISRGQSAPASSAVRPIPTIPT